MALIVALYVEEGRKHILVVLLSTCNIKAKYWITVVIYGREKEAEFL